MKISVIGTGYVGLVTGTCFAEMGNKVTCIDIDAKKVASMQEGHCPIYEPGLEELLISNIKSKRIFFATNYDSIKDCKLVFMAVGTPSRDDGSADLKYVYAALDSLINVMQDGLIIVLKSTVPVGTGDNVKKYLSEKTNKKFVVVNNPEFLKEGSAVDDFMKPERVIVGTDDDEAFKVVEELYAPFNRQTKRTIRMSNISAEITKYAANCFLATKISFMNEMARLCDLVGGDVEEVRHGISTDSRIGGQFLYPGPGYGGSCFPKDVKALIHTGNECGLKLEIVAAAEHVNKDQKKIMAQKALKHFGNVKGKTFALWGVAFKANTDDIRETAAIDTTLALLAEGAHVRFYDPVAAGNFAKHMKELGKTVEGFSDRYDVLDGADALIILTEWNEFRSPEFSEIKRRLRTPVIFDGRNLFSTKEVKKEGLKYYAVGKRI